MKILLSCVNSVVSLIGFDTAVGQSFWYCPANLLRACGAAYDGGALLIATDNSLTRLSEANGIEKIALPGPHDNVAHSVHALEGLGIGVADTGNSRILVYGRDLAGYISFDALEGWGDIPADAIHLNDFTRTPHGIVASCFNYRPYRMSEVPGFRWQDKGYGLLVSLEKLKGRNIGRILACGLDCPHSVVWHKDYLYCCASATGEFLRFSRTEQGTLREEARILITKDHFLRGALPLEDEKWLLGGSTLRRQQSKGMELLAYNEKTGLITTQSVAPAGEIYDILPWNDEIMIPVARMLNKLPPAYDDGENKFPPPMTDFP